MLNKRTYTAFGIISICWYLYLGYFWDHMSIYGTLSASIIYLFTTIDIALCVCILVKLRYDKDKQP